MKYIILVFVIFTIIGCESTSTKEETNILVNIPELINRSPEEVEKILGTPDNSYFKVAFRHKVLVYEYEAENMEVRFPKNIASEIIIKNPLPFKYEPNTLKSYGITAAKPTKVVTDGFMKWENIPGFKVVSMYIKHLDTEGKVDNFDILFTGS